jgi:hypothetical protein
VILRRGKLSIMCSMRVRVCFDNDNDFICHIREIF